MGVIELHNDWQQHIKIYVITNTLNLFGAGLISISRVFIGKDNSLGSQIASKTVGVKVKTVEEKIEKKMVTPMAVYIFDAGEVEIRKIFVEELKSYPETNKTVTISASDFLQP